MSNIKDQGETRDTRHRLAALMAVHLVGQVLEDAKDIATAAKEAGQPWRCLSMYDYMKYIKIEDVEKDYVDLIPNASNKGILTTSTPEQLFVKKVTDIVNEDNYIGQGDEEYDNVSQNELTKPTRTSIFINNLFDMSEVERFVYDDTDETKSVNNTNDLPAQAITKITESYVDSALNMILDDHIIDNVPVLNNSARSTEYSGYSFLADAFVDNINNVGNNKNPLYMDCNLALNAMQCIDVTEAEKTPEEPSKLGERLETEDPQKEISNVRVSNELAFYENTFLTLNRDYDQCSEDNDDNIMPVLEDPKTTILQEIELLATHHSNEELASRDKPKENITKFGATSAVSHSSRNSIVRRCRIQSARLFSCFRGLWRRKSPKHLKEIRHLDEVRGLYPISPDARRRATSMLDHRVGSPLPTSRSNVWKFNTVNEALVNSVRWKEYSE